MPKECKEMRKEMTRWGAVQVPRMKMRYTTLSVAETECFKLPR
jgi:hypothetical protein